MSECLVFVDQPSALRTVTGMDLCHYGALTLPARSRMLKVAGGCSRSNEAAKSRV